ncbi:MAG: DEAD/DEAH box helicase [Acetobacteraceae bacterium]|nr:DEAD/DEAH box helicase [Acetobacteraceae bacterium]
MTTQSFVSLGLAEPILRALAAQDFTTPTPIQAGSIPLLLDGRDLLGIAQTGTGKTGAFGLPLLHHLAAQRFKARPFATRALILAPTRELALQIDAALRGFGAQLRLSTCVILGGVGRRPQEERMRRGPDIVVGTPGRIRDLMGTRHLQLDQVTHFVLDEADRMLDLGFIRDIRHIVAALPASRQSSLFSATMPEEVGQLAASFLREPQRLEITPEIRTPEKIEQSVHFVGASGKNALLVELLRQPAFERVIVFTRTKRGANRVAEHLEAAAIGAEALHGNKSQSAREKSLDRFRTGRARVLVATDIASRGIDVKGITHVVNFDLPVEPESYVHRIGRTARAGAEGIAISFCDHAERPALRAIERLTGAKLRPVGEVPAERAESPGARPRSGPYRPQPRPFAKNGAERGPNSPPAAARPRRRSRRRRPVSAAAA